MSESLGVSVLLPEQGMSHSPVSGSQHPKSLGPHSPPCTGSGWGPLTSHRGGVAQGDSAAWPCPGGPQPQDWGCAVLGRLGALCPCGSWSSPPGQCHTLPSSPPPRPELVPLPGVVQEGSAWGRRGGRVMLVSVQRRLCSVNSSLGAVVAAAVVTAVRRAGKTG